MSHQQRERPATGRPLNTAPCDYNAVIEHGKQGFNVTINGTLIASFLSEARAIQFAKAVRYE